MAITYEENIKQRSMRGKAEHERSDEYYTTAEQVKKVLPLVREHMQKHGGKILCPFDCERSQFVKLLKGEGYEVDFGDLNNNGKDFFTSWDLSKYSLVISNPPFSLWHDILSRLLESGVPFAMLTRYDGLIAARGNYAIVERHHETMSLLMTCGKMFFERPSGARSQVPFYVSWICNKFTSEQAIFLD